MWSFSSHSTFYLPLPLSSTNTYTHIPFWFALVWRDWGLHSVSVWLYMYIHYSTIKSLITYLSAGPKLRPIKCRILALLSSYVWRHNMLASGTILLWQNASYCQNGNPKNNSVSIMIHLNPTENDQCTDWFMDCLRRAHSHSALFDVVTPPLSCPFSYLYIGPSYPTPNA